MKEMMNRLGNLCYLTAVIFLAVGIYEGRLGGIMPVVLIPAALGYVLTGLPRRRSERAEDKS